MKVSQQGREFVIICDAEEFDMLEHGLGWFVSECDSQNPSEDVVLAKQMMTDIANCEAC